VVRYDDVNMDSDVSSISMSINNGLFAQLPSIQQLQPKVDSNPIADRVHRKRQRLPSNDPIETAPTPRAVHPRISASGQSR